MIYKLLYRLTDFWFGFNVFRYITVRATLALFTSFLLSVALGPWMIRKLKDFCHPILLEFRQNKTNTPTLGGFLILGSILVSLVFWADMASSYVLLLVLTTVWLGTFGFWDDYLKLRNRNPRGLRPRVKILGQAGVGAILGLVLCFLPGLDFSTDVFVPFCKNVCLSLGVWYVLVTILITVATSNAVNLTDGMDGLAIGLIMMGALGYGVIAYIAGNVNFAAYLNIAFVPGAGEITVFAAAMVGACLGFLWFNAHPAEIFMGDVGSLALGGIIGLFAILVKQEISLILMGGVFVAEALSVIIQVISFKRTGRRMFLMTPLHHHFELKGWPENKVVIRFWIAGILLALFTMITLKIR